MLKPSAASQFDGGSCSSCLSPFSSKSSFSSSPSKLLSFSLSEEDLYSAELRYKFERLELGTRTERSVLDNGTTSRKETSLSDEYSPSSFSFTSSFSFSSSCSVIDFCERDNDDDCDIIGTLFSTYSNAFGRVFGEYCPVFSILFPLISFRDELVDENDENDDDGDGDGDGDGERDDIFVNFS